MSLKDVTQSGDLLGAVARVPLSVPLGRLTQDTVKLQFDFAKYPPDLLYWTLRSPEYRAYCRERAIGTTNLSLSRDDFLAFELPAATANRLELVALLETLERRIDLLRQTNATLESIAQALFKSWFIDFDPVRAKAEGREPEGMDAATAALFPAEFQESALGLIPKGWRVGLVEDLLLLQRGFDLPATKRREGAYPVLAASGPSGTHDEAMVRGPGVTTGRSGVIGGVHFVHGDYWPLNTSLWVKEFKVASPEWAYQFLRTLDLRRLNAGSAVPTLNRNHVHAQPAVIPPVGLVIAYTKVGTAMLRREQGNEICADSLRDLRDVLLPRLISGKLRLSEAEGFASQAAHA
ncbi:MAG: restriction endonuclease subunit S [Rubrivivax sp.]|nr:restriction endonuclease subunit S [Rubrivivax sp.]